MVHEWLWLRVLLALHLLLHDLVLVAVGHARSRSALSHCWPTAPQSCHPRHACCPLLTHLVPQLPLETVKEEVLQCRRDSLHRPAKRRATTIPDCFVWRCDKNIEEEHTVLFS